MNLNVLHGVWCGLTRAFCWACHSSQLSSTACQQHDCLYLPPVLRYMCPRYSAKTVSQDYLRKKRCQLWATGTYYSPLGIRPDVTKNAQDCVICGKLCALIAVQGCKREDASNKHQGPHCPTEGSNILEVLQQFPWITVSFSLIYI